MITVRALAGAQGRGAIMHPDNKDKAQHEKKNTSHTVLSSYHSLIYHEYFNIICCTQQIKLPREKKNEAMIFYAKEHSETK